MNGQATAATAPINNAPISRTIAEINENMRTKNPTVRETRLSSAARNLSSKERPGGVTIIFHGANRVRRSIPIEKDSSTFLTRPAAPLAARIQPSPYHHWKNSIKSISLIVP